MCNPQRFTECFPYSLLLLSSSPAGENSYPYFTKGNCKPRNCQSLDKLFWPVRDLRFQICTQAAFVQCQEWNPGSPISEASALVLSHISSPDIL